MALLHYPVKNKDGKAIAAAVTSIDLHDIARAARTYGIGGLYVITPLADQREFAGKIINHWVKGAGAKYNPDRKEALSMISLREDLQEAVNEIRTRENTEVRIVATSAAGASGQTEFDEFRRALESGEHAYLLVLGTAWGLSDEFMNEADCRLAPIVGNTDYNHLSVRSAASIILDRLLGGNTG
ncbi:MAG: RNA methyltransferase [Desulfobacteraceae bacterium]|nr:RNA methyltransferase [Desulfobacteraceae bacterium]MCF8095799.1 RNA methyltransferase [Desulfobacteraceae bacterium]